LIVSSGITDFTTNTSVSTTCFKISFAMIYLVCKPV
jgi:hypothetical protein